MVLRLDSAITYLDEASAIARGLGRDKDADDIEIYTSDLRKIKRSLMQKDSHETLPTQ